MYKSILDLSSELEAVQVLVQWTYSAVNLSQTSKVGASPAKKKLSLLASLEVSSRAKTFVEMVS